MSPATVAAFFDVDNTIIRGASSFHLARALHAEGYVRSRDIARFGVDQARYLVWGENCDRLGDIRSRALGLVAGWSVDDVATLGERVYDDVLSARVFPGTRRLLDAHRDAGHQVWLVTAAPVEIADLVARRLGATGALATVAERADGVYTGRLHGEVMHGAQKARAARELAEREGIDLEASYAYGDSLNDVALLASVGHPCAVNPEPRLRRLARSSGWAVEEFRSTSRRATHTGVRTASWAGGAWVATVAVRRVTRALAARAH
ncbi:HAD family hydrolase [Luteimicrobium subarcticum]|uniref:HAD superfamily hydrolase (TIGR01490 family) n=1 Tax=Luteimicrobium subarcticum TaxID=620910 RepID=A0A2M8WVS3_9MICO|nr:HAD-IB family hydrolase [Luteimicrobium subarcticum]PJI95025.1 HAD superfamily hydrolase (TIGR01490 family) [Luteimicrobium subarcticum]